MATNGVKVPTAPIGYMSEEVWFHEVFLAFEEQIPELQGKAASWTYNSMRRDPRLTAVLSAYTLPIRRAVWSINPAGCRPEAVQLVADGLGLPVIGVDEQTAARTRGVSWREHLRAALLHLVWGHMGFELGASVDDAGVARLESLSERMPHTIAEMLVNRNGDLTGVTQYAVPGDKTIDGKLDVIDSSRLLWYAHDREGANWAGTSLLRPAYSPWVLKREMLRVHATGSRRFGMGVPVVVWAPGSNPTPAQHTAAAVIAETARSGEFAGAALPPGASLQLVGLSGGVPDVMAFVHYLDVSMSQMVLAGFLDLGQSAHGSRALGNSFIDLFMLSLGAISEGIADSVTREVAARIVEWNFGPDEPVPAVTVSDVASTHEVTAESLAQLMQFGAITPDVALDSYVRKLWGLPARTGPWVAPKGEGAAPGPTPTPTPTPNPSGDVQARTVRAAAGDGSGDTEQVGNRPPSPDEEAAGVDFQAIADDHAAATAALLAVLAGLTAAIVTGLAADAAASVAGGTVSGLADLAVPDDEVTALSAGLGSAMDALSVKAAAGAVAEAKHQGMAVAKPKRPGADENTAVADVMARLIADGLRSAAVRTALQQSSGTEDEVRQAVQDALATMTASDARCAGDNAHAAMSAAQAAGRAAVMSQAPEKTIFLAAEQLDHSSCQPCIDVDGTRYDTWQEALATHPQGPYVNCLGHWRCRGQVVALYPKP